MADEEDFDAVGRPTTSLY